MSQIDRQGDEYLDQLDRLLYDGRLHGDPFINSLANTIPQADRVFRQELEHRLLAHLQPQRIIKEEYSLMTTARRIHPVINPPLTWAITLTVAALAVAGIILINLNRGRTSLAPQTPAAAAQTDQPVSVVIATQDIQAGTVITDAMVGMISISQADANKLSLIRPIHEFMSDVHSVVGQTASVTIHWFQPFETILLGEPVSSCEIPCQDVPAHYMTIGFPVQEATLQGLKIGDRADVLAVVDGEIRVIAANVFMTNIEQGIVSFTVPEWKLGVLLWLYHNGEPYTLRLHTGNPPEVVDNSPAEVVIATSDTQSLDFVFDLIVNVPASKGYLLTDLPAEIEATPFTTDGDTLYFRFKNLEVVSMTDNIAVTLRLPGRDAANLDYLTGLQDVTLSFVPAEPR